MSRRKIAAGNWKMNTLSSEAKQWLTAFAQRKLDSKTEIVICAPFTHLYALYSLGLDQIRLGAQDIYTKDSGAYTGEISGAMLKDVGATHVIIGHSERREYFQETNEFLAAKLRHAIEHDLVPIFCCGESLDVRKSKKHEAYVIAQLQESLKDFDEAALSNLVIAYEPIWAIGTGETASPEQAQEMHEAIRTWLKIRFSSVFAQSTPILYGGSVKANNAVELFAQKDIDGGLVGGASLVVDEFAAICNAF